ncbi:hypothetical protein D3C75_1066400 [compost metagenome]
MLAQQVTDAVPGVLPVAALAGWIAAELQMFLAHEQQAGERGCEKAGSYRQYCRR